MYATPTYKIEHQQVVSFDPLSIAASACCFGHGTLVRFWGTDSVGFRCRHGLLVACAILALLLLLLVRYTPRIQIYTLHSSAVVVFLLQYGKSSRYTRQLRAVTL